MTSIVFPCFLLELFCTYMCCWFLLLTHFRFPWRLEVVVGPMDGSIVLLPRVTETEFKAKVRDSHASLHFAGAFRLDIMDWINLVANLQPLI